MSEINGCAGCGTKVGSPKMASVQVDLSTLLQFVLADAPLSEATIKKLLEHAFAGYEFSSLYKDGRWEIYVVKSDDADITKGQLVGLV
jgi:hypothetical protein